ncbi:MAG: hypothetical protein JNK48_20545 [Bryobacterales bacterium]|nr:hypothetical protein [Bryobacterales bacterium]
MKQIGFALLALGFQAMAQTPNKVLRFAHTVNEQHMNEIATVTRAISEVKPWADAATRTMRIEGSPEQLAAAEWVFHELDRPLDAAPPSTARVYKMPDAKNEGQVRVFHLAHSPSVQALQELATAIRAATEVRRLFTMGDARIIVVRGTEEQVAVADWLLQQLDTPQKPGFSVSRERPMSDPQGEGYLRIFYPRTVTTVQQLQEMATCTRALAEIRRLFTYNVKNAIVVRGTAERLKLAEWLLLELDQKPRTEYAASPQYVMPDIAAEGFVKVFFAPHKKSAAELQALAVEVRTTTQVRRLFTYNTPSAICVRGTANQIARAEELVAATVKKN